MAEAEAQLEHMVDELKEVLEDERRSRKDDSSAGMAIINEVDEMEIEVDDVGESQMLNLASGIYSPEKAKMPPSPKLKQVTTHTETVSSFKQHITVENIPSTHVVVQKSLLTSLKDDCRIVVEIKQNLRKNRFSATRQKFPLARDYLATALGVAPALCHQAASLMIPLTIMWFLHWL